MDYLTIEQQSHHLLKVSRTFALTIPVLPKKLADWVGNAYLLCRIADTIEDDPKLDNELKKSYLLKFTKSLENKNDDYHWLEDLCNLISDSAKPDELALMKDIPLVLGRFFSYGENIQEILKHGVSIMCEGMAQFDRWKNINNLDNVDHYCYSVAGVVGEILVKLFAEYSSIIKSRLDKLLPLSVCFGEALQLTNILKDFKEDASRGVCWLPLKSDSNSIDNDIKKYVEIAYGHALQALDFILLIPRREKGIRLFCLWANAMAVLTLKNIYLKSNFNTAQEIKISRSDVKKVVIQTRFLVYSNLALKLLFEKYANKQLKAILREPSELRNKVTHW